MTLPKLYISFFLLTIFSCKLTKTNITGSYLDHYNFENSTKLTVNENKTFFFQMQAGLMFFNTKGNWNLLDDTLHLFSFDANSMRLPVIKQISESKNGTTSIYVIDSLGLVPFEYEYMNKNNYCKDTLTFSFDDTNDTLRIKPLPFKEIRLTKSQLKTGTVEITLFNNPVFYFDNQKYLIQKRKLIELNVKNERTGLKLKRS